MSMNEIPNGLCKKCGFPMVKENSILTCINCKVYSEPSGVVNDVVDPGHNAMAKLPGMGGQIKPISDEKDKALTQAATDEGKKANEKFLQELEKAEIAKPRGIFDPRLSVQEIQAYFSAVPIRDINHAKKLMKLRKQIDSLADQIKTFIGE